MPAPRLVLAGRALPVWVVLLAAYALSRVVVTGMLWLVYALGGGTGAAWAQGTPFLSSAYDPGPSFLGFLSAWDVQWYAAIALQGYPTELPTDAAGDVVPNPWAFFPIFPWIVRGAMFVIGAPATLAGFATVGTGVAVLFGALAVLALHRMLIQAFTPRQAFWGAVFFAFGPISFLLQMAYAESLFLFLMFCALAAMVSRHYWLMIPFALLASFSHPGAMALAAALGMQGITRLWRRQPIRWSEWITAGLAIVLIAAAGLIWPVIAAHVTGDPSAYFDTEAGWWRLMIDGLVFIPFTPFFFLFHDLFGPVGVIGTAIVLVAVVVVMLQRRTRYAFGVDTWTYAASYMLYLVAVFFPTQSLFRMLLPLAPLYGYPGLSSTRRRRMIVIGVSILAMPICIQQLWLTYPP